MEIIESILTNNPCYKSGKKIKVRGLMLHSVGCPQPSAESFIRVWNSPSYDRACIHAFVDGNTGKIYQTLPWEHRAWHCGGSGNNCYIGVEMCEPGCLKYTSGAKFTCQDKETAMTVVKRTYDGAAELFAFLCNKFGLNPLADGVIVSHNEGHKRGIASGHGDPEHLWSQLETGYTMDTFRNAVKEAMGMTPAAGGKTEEGALEKASEKQSGSDIQAGDTVSLTPDAVYYEGKEMPEWVKTDKWIVKSVAGDRAVIDRNISDSRAICSPVNVKHLIKE